ncbi:MAG: stage II sporulation protein M [archaeon]
MKKRRGRKVKRKSLENCNFFCRNFIIALVDLRKLRTYFWFSLILFFVIGFFGYLFPVFFVDEISEIIQELIKQTEGLGALGLIRFIVANNIWTGFMAMILGTILAVPPLIVLVVNGYILGFVSRASVDTEGILILWRLLPHGILEIPAVLISMALGIRLGMLLMKEVIETYRPNISKVGEVVLIALSILIFPIAFFVYMILTAVDQDLKISFIENVKYSFRVFFFIVVPLLVIAGIIEGILIGLVG